MVRNLFVIRFPLPQQREIESRIMVDDTQFVIEEEGQQIGPHQHLIVDIPVIGARLGAGKVIRPGVPLRSFAEVPPHWVVEEEVAFEFPLSSLPPRYLPSHHGMKTI